ncbi:hypothetical protein BGZ90_007445 [Linnemannia elongata]|nr:hypothetical protein BGZ90_007445 [Linnemannia elongata]
MVLLSFFIFTIRDAGMVEWWGNPAADICRLDSYPLMAPRGGMDDPWADPELEDVPNPFRADLPPLA